MKLSRDGTEIEEVTEPEGWTDEDRKRTREVTGADLPVLITDPGWYWTRNGKRVRIDKVKAKWVATFNCSGNLYLQERTAGNRERIQWNIWSDNGRWKALGEHSYDIVRKA